MNQTKSLVVTVALLSFVSGLVLGAPDAPGLTIYNQNFAVVRQPLKLELEAGINKIQFTETTVHLEPDSVILRDPVGEWQLQILEQNFRADPISQGLLLSLFEGQVIDFLIGSQVVPGRIIRSGYQPHQRGLHSYGDQYYANQMGRATAGGGQPIIEIDSRLRFGLPGVPLFPSLRDDTILKPTLDWQIVSDRGGSLEAELGYVTGGMSWEATYNLVAPQEGDVIELVGWVTIDNQSGKGFKDSRIKLMAGDVKKLEPGAYDRMARKAARAFDMSEMAPVVTEKRFDEYHLYTLSRPATLHDRETKQVEFVRAAGVAAERIYVYDGLWMDPNRWAGYNSYHLRQEPDYGAESNSKVWVMQQFANTEENQLGIPLPRGRLRFYRRDDDGQLEFTGENWIDHTPRDETIRVHTGNAFDLVGERQRTDFKVDSRGHWVDESFQLKLRNRKEEPVEIRLVEHLYRWSNWEITRASEDYEKLDSQTIEFRIPVEPDQEKTLTYSVHYSW